MTFTKKALKYKMNAIANRQAAIAWPFWYMCQSVATVREHKIYKPITQLDQTQCGQTRWYAI